MLVKPMETARHGRRPTAGDASQEKFSESLTDTHPDLAVCEVTSAVGYSVLPVDTAETGSRAWAFPTMWLTIGAISAFDTYLTVKYQEDLFRLELNPIGCWLLNLDGGEPALLIGLKFLGSTLVLGILALLYLRHRRIGLAVTIVLTGLQVALLGYLVL